MARHPSLKAILVAAIVAGVSHLAGAQSPKERLAKATGIDCTFTASVSANWKTGAPIGTLKPSQLRMQFDEVNADEGSARVIGPFGASDIIVRLSVDTLHLIQSFRDGPLYSTTIFPKEKNGRFQAVHSRHELTDIALPGYTSSPEQYYGDCLITP